MCFEHAQRKGTQVLEVLYILHPRIVFADKWKAPLDKEAFGIARKVVDKDMAPLALDIFFRERTPHRVFELLYALVMEEELAQLDLIQNRLNRMLVEVVILHRLLSAEKNQGQEDALISRRLVVLGWMIQERLTHLMLQTQTSQYDQVFAMGWMPGIDRMEWETRIVGASAEAKAVQELALAGGLDIYESTIHEDVVWGIDLLVEIPGTGEGVCLSVKTQSEPKTRFHPNVRDIPDEKTYAEWEKIARGTLEFNSKARRAFKPMLLKVGRINGQRIDLNMNGEAEGWTEELKAAFAKDEWLTYTPTTT